MAENRVSGADIKRNLENYKASKNASSNGNAQYSQKNNQSSVNRKTLPDGYVKSWAGQDFAKGFWDAGESVSNFGNLSSDSSEAWNRLTSGTSENAVLDFGEFMSKGLVSQIFTSVGAPIEGVAQLWEAATGDDIQNMKDGYISEDKLSVDQRIGGGISGAINIASVIPQMGGSVARAAKAGFGTLGGALERGTAGVLRSATANTAEKLAKSEAKTGFRAMLDPANENFNKGVAGATEVARQAFSEGAEEYIQQTSDTVRDADNAYTDENRPGFLEAWTDPEIQKASLSAAGAGALLGSVGSIPTIVANNKAYKTNTENRQKEQERAAQSQAAGGGDSSGVVSGVDRDQHDETLGQERITNAAKEANEASVKDIAGHRDNAGAMNVGGVPTLAHNLGATQSQGTLDVSTIRDLINTGGDDGVEVVSAATGIDQNELRALAQQSTNWAAGSDRRPDNLDAGGNRVTEDPLAARLNEVAGNINHGFGVLLQVRKDPDAGFKESNVMGITHFTSSRAGGLSTNQPAATAITMDWDGDKPGARLMASLDQEANYVNKPDTRVACFSKDGTTLYDTVEDSHEVKLDLTEFRSVGNDAISQQNARTTTRELLSSVNTLDANTVDALTDSVTNAWQQDDAIAGGFGTCKNRLVPAIDNVYKTLIGPGGLDRIAAARVCDIILLSARNDGYRYTNRLMGTIRNMTGTNLNLDARLNLVRDSINTERLEYVRDMRNNRETAYRTYTGEIENLQRRERDTRLTPATDISEARINDFTPAQIFHAFGMPEYLGDHRPGDASDNIVFRCGASLSYLGKKPAGAKEVSVSPEQFLSMLRVMIRYHCSIAEHEAHKSDNITKLYNLGCQVALDKATRFHSTQDFFDWINGEGQYKGKGFKKAQNKMARVYQDAIEGYSVFDDQERSNFLVAPKRECDSTSDLVQEFVTVFGNNNFANMFGFSQDVMDALGLHMNTTLDTALRFLSNDHWGRTNKTVLTGEQYKLLETLLKGYRNRTVINGSVVINACTEITDAITAQGEDMRTVLDLMPETNFVEENPGVNLKDVVEGRVQELGLVRHWKILQDMLEWLNYVLSGENSIIIGVQDFRYAWNRRLWRESTYNEDGTVTNLREESTQRTLGQILVGKNASEELQGFILSAQLFSKFNGNEVMGAITRALDSTNGLNAATRMQLLQNASDNIQQNCFGISTIQDIVAANLQFVIQEARNQIEATQGTELNTRSFENFIRQTYLWELTSLDAEHTFKYKCEYINEFFGMELNPNEIIGSCLENQMERDGISETSQRLAKAEQYKKKVQRIKDDTIQRTLEKVQQKFAEQGLNWREFVEWIHARHEQARTPRAMSNLAYGQTMGSKSKDKSMATDSAASLYSIDAQVVLGMGGVSAVDQATALNTHNLTTAQFWGNPKLVFDVLLGRAKVRLTDGNGVIIRRNQDGGNSVIDQEYLWSELMPEGTFANGFDVNLLQDGSMWLELFTHNPTIASYVCDWQYDVTNFNGVPQASISMTNDMVSCADSFIKHKMEEKNHTVDYNRKRVRDWISNYVGFNCQGVWADSKVISVVMMLMDKPRDQYHSFREFDHDFQKAFDKYVDIVEAILVLRIADARGAVTWDPEEFGLERGASIDEFIDSRFLQAVADEGINEYIDAYSKASATRLTADRTFDDITAEELDALEVNARRQILDRIITNVTPETVADMYVPAGEVNTARRDTRTPQELINETLQRLIARGTNEVRHNVEHLTAHWLLADWYRSRTTDRAPFNYRAENRFNRQEAAQINRAMEEHLQIINRAEAQATQAAVTDTTAIPVDIMRWAGFLPDQLQGDFAALLQPGPYTLEQMRLRANILVLATTNLQQARQQATLTQMLVNQDPDVLIRQLLDNNGYNNIYELLANEFGYAIGNLNLDDMIFSVDRLAIANRYELAGFSRFISQLSPSLLKQSHIRMLEALDSVQYKADFQLTIAQAFVEYNDDIENGAEIGSVEEFEQELENMIQDAQSALLGRILFNINSRSGYNRDASVSTFLWGDQMLRTTNALTNELLGIEQAGAAMTAPVQDLNVPSPNNLNRTELGESLIVLSAQASDALNTLREIRFPSITSGVQQSCCTDLAERVNSGHIPYKIGVGGSQQQTLITPFVMMGNAMFACESAMDLSNVQQISLRNAHRDANVGTFAITKQTADALGIQFVPFVNADMNDDPLLSPQGEKLMIVDDSVSFGTLLEAREMAGENLGNLLCYPYNVAGCGHIGCACHSAASGNFIDNVSGADGQQQTRARGFSNWIGSWLKIIKLMLANPQMEELILQARKAPPVGSGISRQWMAQAPLIYIDANGRNVNIDEPLWAGGGGSITNGQVNLVRDRILQTQEAIAQNIYQIVNDPRSGANFQLTHNECLMIAQMKSMMIRVEYQVGGNTFYDFVSSGRVLEVGLEQAIQEVATNRTQNGLPINLRTNVTNIQMEFESLEQVSLRTQRQYMINYRNELNPRRAAIAMYRSLTDFRGLGYYRDNANPDNNYGGRGTFNLRSSIDQMNYIKERGVSTIDTDQARSASQKALDAADQVNDILRPGITGRVKNEIDSRNIKESEVVDLEEGQWKALDDFSTRMQQIIGSTTVRGTRARGVDDSQGILSDTPRRTIFIGYSFGDDVDINRQTQPVTPGVPGGAFGTRDMRATNRRIVDGFKTADKNGVVKSIHSRNFKRPSMADNYDSRYAIVSYHRRTMISQTKEDLLWAIKNNCDLFVTREAWESIQGDLEKFAGPGFQALVEDAGETASGWIRINTSEFNSIQDYLGRDISKPPIYSEPINWNDKYRPVPHILTELDADSAQLYNDQDPEIVRLFATETTAQCTISPSDLSQHFSSKFPPVLVSRPTDPVLDMPGGGQINAQEYTSDLYDAMWDFMNWRNNQATYNGGYEFEFDVDRGLIVATLGNVVYQFDFSYYIDNKYTFDECVPRLYAFLQNLSSGNGDVNIGTRFNAIDPVGLAISQHTAGQGQQTIITVAPICNPDAKQSSDERSGYVLTSGLGYDNFAGSAGKISFMYRQEYNPAQAGINNTVVQLKTSAANSANKGIANPVSDARSAYANGSEGALRFDQYSTVTLPGGGEEHLSNGMFVDEDTYLKRQNNKKLKNNASDIAAMYDRSSIGDIRDTLYYLHHQFGNNFFDRDNTRSSITNPGVQVALFSREMLDRQATGMSLVDRLNSPNTSECVAAIREILSNDIPIFNAEVGYGYAGEQIMRRALANIATGRSTHDGSSISTDCVFLAGDECLSRNKGYQKEYFFSDWAKDDIFFFFHMQYPELCPPSTDGSNSYGDYVSPILPDNYTLDEQCRIKRQADGKRVRFVMQPLVFMDPQGTDTYSIDTKLSNQRLVDQVASHGGPKNGREIQQMQQLMSYNLGRYSQAADIAASNDRRYRRQMRDPQQRDLAFPAERITNNPNIRDRVDRLNNPYRPEVIGTNIEMIPGMGEYLEECRVIAKKSENRPQIVDKDGNILSDTDLEKNSVIQEISRRMSNLFEWNWDDSNGVTINFVINILVNGYMGFTPDGKGNFSEDLSVSTQSMMNAYNAFEADYRRALTSDNIQWFIKGGTTTGGTRISCPIISPSALTLMIRHSNIGRRWLEIEARNQDIDLDFASIAQMDAIYEEVKTKAIHEMMRQNNEADLAAQMKYKKDKNVAGFNAVRKFADARRLQYLDYPETPQAALADLQLDSGDCISRNMMTFIHQVQIRPVVGRAAFGNNEAAYQEYMRMCEETDQLVEAYWRKSALEEGTVTRHEDGSYTYTHLSSEKTRRAQHAMRGMTRHMKTMAISTPQSFAANFVDKEIGVRSRRTAQRIAMQLGDLRLMEGAQQLANFVSEDFHHNTRLCADDQVAVELFDIMLTMQLNESDFDTIAAFTTVQELRAWRKQHRNKGGKIERAENKIMDIASADWAAKRAQFRAWLTDWLMKEAANGNPILFQRVGREGRVECLAETLMRENPVMLLRLAFSQTINGETNSSYINARSAMNSSLATTWSKETPMTILLTSLFKRSATFEFLTSCTVSTFPKYAINTIERYARFIMPYSSLNRLFSLMLMRSGETRVNENGETESVTWLGRLVDRRFGQDTSKALAATIASVQQHDSMRAAIISDVVHLSATAMACALFALPAFQPPEDDDKIGIIDEWLWFGQPIKLDWFVKDSVGMPLYVAAWWKSCTLGKPRMRLITDCLEDILPNKCATDIWHITNMFFDIDSAMEEDAGDSDWSKYKDGEPSTEDYILAQFMNLSYGILDNFLPSALRNWYRNSSEYERDYSKQYLEDGTTGSRIIDEYGNPTTETEKVSWYEAQVRKRTSKNLAGAVIENIKNQTLFGSGDKNSYWSWDMPLRKYTDPYELASADQYNIYKEDGTTLKDDYGATCVEIIMKLVESDDMQALRDSGFYIPYDTKMYLSNEIYQTIQMLKSGYYADYSSAFTESFGEYGSQIAESLESFAEESTNSSISALKNFYYEKLWSEPMRQGLTYYNRKLTTYETDDSGNLYATGYSPSSVFNLLPIQFMETTNSTGSEGDWATKSALTGEGMYDKNGNGMRALEAVSNLEDRPTLDSFAQYNQNGNGGYNYGGYGYGGYGSGGGGGGGGSYARTANRVYPSTSKFYDATYRDGRTRVYGHRVNFSRPNLGNRVSAKKLYDTTLDYLRPGFETKGSREAYRRQDF